MRAAIGELVDRTLEQGRVNWRHFQRADFASPTDADCVGQGWLDPRTRIGQGRYRPMAPGLVSVEQTRAVRAALRVTAMRWRRVRFEGDTQRFRILGLVPRERAMDPRSPFWALEVLRRGDIEDVASRDDDEFEITVRAPAELLDWDNPSLDPATIVARGGPGQTICETRFAFQIDHSRGDSPLLAYTTKLTPASASLR